MDEKQLFLKAAKYCAKRETCESEIRQKLIKWGASTAQLMNIIQQLKQQNYINHKRYAIAFINDHLKIYGWGRHKIKLALLQRGIDEQTISQAMNTIDSSEYEKILHKVLVKKLKTLRTGNNLKERLYSFAVQKGFESELVLRIIEKILDK